MLKAMEKLRKNIKHRAFIELYEAPKEYLDLSGDMLKRFGKILRLKSGDKVELFNGQGLTIVGELDFETKSLKVLGSKSFEKNKHETNKLTLFQAWVSLDKCEQVVQRATEIGVDQIFFIKTERSQEKIKKLNTDKKLERLNKIAQDAARQSWRVYVPKIIGVLSLEQALRSMRGLECQQFVGELDAQASLMDHLLCHSSLELESCSKSETLSHAVAVQSDENLAVWVGPEGGFSAEELELLKQSGVMGVTWAPHVLRTETAGLVALSQIRGLLCKSQV